MSSINNRLREALERITNRPLLVKRNTMKDELADDPTVSIKLHSAINGKILEIVSCNSEDNWIREYMIINEGEDLVAAIGTLMMVSKANK